MDYLARRILLFYFDICFSSFDVGALERAELEKLIGWNRGLAKLMLVPGSLMLLPPLVLALYASLAMGSGQAWVFGLPAEFCLVFSLGAMLLAHLLLPGILVFLCIFRLEWEPLGFALALTDLLGTTLGVLQNIWRALVLLPFLALCWISYFS